MYFKSNLRPYWRRRGKEIGRVLQHAQAGIGCLPDCCEAFDKELLSDMRRVGGEKYAQICALAYRQCLAANKLVADANGMPLLFPKENFSNGCIATVDVLYPQAPMFLLFSPTLTKAMLRPVLDYAASPRWKFPYAPHDLGAYPMANGQVYGGGELTEQGQMPVEETGNMLVLLGALAQAEGNARFAEQYWPLLTRWAEFLVSKGLDPENQLCTDDFAGHLAHNVNLSAKAIVALGAFAELCRQTGHTQEAGKYRQTAEQFAARWIDMANDGDHTRLAFDKPGTWSQKYNLIWDRVLDLKLFPEAVIAREIAFYKKMQNRFGLPLDNRQSYTKLDWSIWTASLAEKPEDFQALVDPVYAFLQHTPDRVPMTDWYWTLEPKKKGFQARSVVGGVFIKALLDRPLWQKWARRAAPIEGQWAPLPVARPTAIVVPTAKQEPLVWRYTTQKPAGEWFAPGFDASGWNEGPAGFGTPRTPRAVVRTVWKTSDIWLRREFALGSKKLCAPKLLMHHDEDAEIYLNGILAATVSGYTTAYDEFPISPEAAVSLRPGKNTIAVHCHQTTGGQYIDVGLVQELDSKR